MKIGNYQFDTPLILAPMAGVTDRPFRSLCRRLGADFCVSEMITSQKHLRQSRKTRLRMDHRDETGPCCVQIAGTEPAQMAEAAQFNAAHGADIIDINMGCPAKKVCQVMAGSALMRDEFRVSAILEAVVSAVEIPVTLKIRTGWDHHNRNALRIAKIAENSGIAALTIHGRTRSCAFRGEAEYDTIAEVKKAISIPVIANGDINSPQKARQVLDYTRADALMIGRAAQGNPWIFREIYYFLQHNRNLHPPENKEIILVLLEHLKKLYNFYGETAGVRIARKHIKWYCNHQPETNSSGTSDFRKKINAVTDAAQQQELVSEFFTANNFSELDLEQIRTEYAEPDHNPDNKKVA